MTAGKKAPRLPFRQDLDPAINLSNKSILEKREMAFTACHSRLQTAQDAQDLLPTFLADAFAPHHVIDSSQRL